MRLGFYKTTFFDLFLLMRSQNFAGMSQQLRAQTQASIREQIISYVDLELKTGEKLQLVSKAGAMPYRPMAVLNGNGSIATIDEYKAAFPGASSSPNNNPHISADFIVEGVDVPFDDPDIGILLGSAVQAGNTGFHRYHALIGRDNNVVSGGFDECWTTQFGQLACNMSVTWTFEHQDLAENPDYCRNPGVTLAQERSLYIPDDTGCTGGSSLGAITCQFSNWQIGDPIQCDRDTVAILRTTWNPHNSNIALLFQVKIQYNLVLPPTFSSTFSSVSLDGPAVFGFGVQTILPQGSRCSRHACLTIDRARGVFDPDTAVRWGINRQHSPQLERSTF